MADTTNRDARRQCRDGHDETVDQDRKATLCGSDDGACNRSNLSLPTAHRMRSGAGGLVKTMASQR